MSPHRSPLPVADSWLLSESAAGGNSILHDLLNMDNMTSGHLKKLAASVSLLNVLSCS